VGGAMTASSSGISRGKNAVKQLESLTADLDKLSGAEKAEFRAFMLREAAAHPRPAVAAEISQFAEAAFSEEE
jgi:hypothetical protein